MRVTHAILLLLLAFALVPWGGAGCANAPHTQAAEGDAGPPRDDALPSGPPSVWTAGAAADLFAVDHVPQFEITVSENQWQWLQANAKKEEYVPAQATYEGRPAGLIGLRFKGNFGTLINCIDSANRITCAKLSLKVSFEEYDPDNRFFGLKKVNLHSMIHDASKLHERLAYDLYRSSGVHAPRSTWANVKVNGKSYGLFSLVEEVDGRFTTDRWPLGGDGNLYKEAWPTSTPPSLFGQKLATNKTTASHDALMSFARAMAAAPTEALGTTLSQWMDLPSLYRYMAVDDAIFNCDGITAFYAPAATGPAWGNHNFYLYQEQSRDFFWLIPWDMDATLSVCAAFVSVPRWNNVPTNCDQNFAVWGGVWAKPPGCDRFFQAVAQTIAQDPALYRLAVDELLAGPFSVQTLTDRIDHWSAFIRDAVVADPTARGEAAWKLAVQELKAVVPRLRERLTPR